MHSGKLLLNGTYPDKFRKNVEKRVRARGIDVVLDDRVELFPEAGDTLDLETRGGKMLEDVDLVVRALPSRALPESSPSRSPRTARARTRSGSPRSARACSRSAAT